MNLRLALTLLITAGLMAQSLHIPRYSHSSRFILQILKNIDVSKLPPLWKKRDDPAIEARNEQIRRDFMRQEGKLREYDGTNDPTTKAWMFVLAFNEKVEKTFDQGEARTNVAGVIAGVAISQAPSLPGLERIMGRVMMALSKPIVTQADDDLSNEIEAFIQEQSGGPPLRGSRNATQILADYRAESDPIKKAKTLLNLTERAAYEQTWPTVFTQFLALAPTDDPYPGGTQFLRAFGGKIPPNWNDLSINERCEGVRASVEDILNKTRIFLTKVDAGPQESDIREFLSLSEFGRRRQFSPEGDLIKLAFGESGKRSYEVLSETDPLKIRWKAAAGAETALSDLRAIIGK